MKLLLIELYQCNDVFNRQHRFMLKQKFNFILNLIPKL